MPIGRNSMSSGAKPVPQISGGAAKSLKFHDGGVAQLVRAAES